jgi:hypothetical protein
MCVIHPLLFFLNILTFSVVPPNSPVSTRSSS